MSLGATRIVRLVPDDWRVHRDLRLTALRTDPQAFGATYADNAAYDEATWRARLAAITYWQARIDGMPVGLVGLWDVVVADDVAEGLVGSQQPVPMLIAMFVRPCARGLGVGDALVAAVQREARERGHCRLLLDVREANAPARALYRRHGFVESRDERPCNESGNACELSMLCDLAGLPS